MHNTVLKNPIRLVHRERGVIHDFKDFSEAVRYWPWLRKLDIGPGPSFKKVWDTPDHWLQDFYRIRVRRGKMEPMEYYHEYVLLDSFGDAVDKQAIRDRYNELHPYRSRLGYPNRSSPGSKRGNYSFWRHPRTTQERRWANAWDDEEFAPKARGARNGHNLPNVWDDIVRQDSEDRNWKRHRKFQWKME